MSKRDATGTIKKLNPENKSGTIKEALNLIQNLKKVKGMMNPKMPDAVGASNLAAAMQQVSQDFAAPDTTTEQDVLTLEKILRKLGPRYGLLVDDVIVFGKELLGYLTFDLDFGVPSDTLDRLKDDIRALTEIGTLIPTYQTIIDNTYSYVKQIRELR